MAKLKECPGCAMEVDNQEDVCPICGYEFPKQSLSMTIAAIVMIILVFLWILF